MSDLITTSGTAITMTSLELVDFINSQRAEGEAELTHANFLAKVPKVLCEGGLIHFQDTYIHPQNGQTYPCYRFPKRESCLMAMSYSYDLQAKVYDRMTQLEAKAAPAVDPMQVLSDPTAMRGLLLTYTEKVIALENKVTAQAAVAAAQTPKVEALDRIALSDGSLCITDAAKTLQIQPRRLTQLLQEHHWTYRRPMGSGWLAYQDRIQSGLMEHKITIGEKGDGREWSSTQARITPKGLTKLAEVVRQTAQL